MPYKIKENLMLASTRVHPLMSIAKERTVNGFATWKELPYIEVGQEKTFYLFILTGITNPSPSSSIRDTK